MAIDCCKSYVGKQIIGLLPSGAEECLYVLAINAQDFGLTDFFGWTLNGNDFITELANYGTVLQYQNDTGNYSVYVYYTGTEPTDLNVSTPGGDILFTIRKVTDFEGGSCDYVCYQASFDYGYQYRYIDYFASGPASPRYFVAAQDIDEVNLYGQLAPFLGPQITVSTVWDGSQYVVTINNAFNLGGFRLGDGAPVYTTFTALPCEITPPEPVPFYLLDLYGGAGAAYSVRRLSSTYSGAALRVRRSSDNGEQDIGFDSNGNLDTSALTSFVGANNGFVVKWYDQTGNLRHMAEVNGSQQPSIVSSGSVITRNGIISLFFNSSSSNKITSNYGLTNGPISTIGVLSLSGTNGNAFIQNNFFGIGVLASNFWGYLSGASVSAVITTVPSSVQYTTGSFALTNNASYLVYGNWNGNSNVVKSRRNGISAANSGVSGSTIRKNDTGPQSYLIGYASEFIIYPSDQASNVAGMETNINGYYNIYP